MKNIDFLILIPKLDINNKYYYNLVIGVDCNFNLNQFYNWSLKSVNIKNVNELTFLNLNEVVLNQIFDLLNNKFRTILNLHIQFLLNDYLFTLQHNYKINTIYYRHIFNMYFWLVLVPTRLILPAAQPQ